MYPLKTTLLITALTLTPILNATTLLNEDFAYSDGPLTGNGPWVRGVSEPSADNPSNYIVVESGKVTFDWSTDAPVNNAVRVQWADAQLTTGMIYAAFDFHATVAPQAAENVRPGFISFDRSGGSQIRGIVGIRAGTDSGTYQLGISASSQVGTNFVFAERDLDTNITYRVIVGYNIVTARTDLWIDAANANLVPDATAYGTSSTGVRRVQLRLYNSDGSDGTTNLGIFHLDNLVVYSGDATTPDPDPDPDPVDLIVPPAPENFFLFLLVGQSNMAGRGVVEAEDLIGDERIAYFNENRQWQIARDPMHWDRPSHNGVGPALSFARNLLPKLPADAVIGLIPAAQGGTPIAQWGKTYSGSYTYYGGQYLYPHAVGRASEAAAVGTLAGILWNQGESDASAAENDNGALYRSRLHQLIADLREDMNNPQLPFIVSTLGPWRTNATAINNVFSNLPSEIAFTATVNTLDPDVAPLLVNNPSDPAHYLTPSYRLLGQLYAEAYSGFIPHTTDIEPLPIVNISLQSGKLQLSWRQNPRLQAQVETSNSLNGPWLPLDTFTTEDLPEDLEFEAPDSLSDDRFFRLRLD